MVRRQVRFGFGAVLLGALVVLSCGSSESGTGPGGGTDGGAGSGGGAGGPVVDSGPYPDVPLEPGTCQPLCCSSDDCDGNACNAFDTSFGTLGICSAGGSSPVVGADLPADCWTVTTPSCNPFTNSGCAAGDACDLGFSGEPDDDPVLDCFGGDNTAGVGEPCEVIEGPTCLPGLHCVPD